MVPTWRGKRGNPVLWARAFFAEMQSWRAMSGARHLIGEHAGAVVEVEADERRGRWSTSTRRRRWPPTRRPAA